MADPQSAQEKFIEGGMHQWWSDSNSISVFITGKSGTGKSTLVNAILGKDVAKVGDKLVPETSEVTSHETTIEDIKVIVWDSPGLQDGTSNEQAYLNDIEKKCKDKVDLLLYCMPMKVERLLTGSIEIEAMCKLTEKLGREIWENAVIVLTHANTRIEYMKEEEDLEGEDDIAELKEKFDEKVEMWKNQIIKCLKNDVKLSGEVVANIPILPAGLKIEPILIQGLTPWLSALWMESLMATKTEAQPALIKMNMQRLEKLSDIQSDKEFNELLKKEKIIINDTATGFGKVFKAYEAGQAVGTRVANEMCSSQRVLRENATRLPGVKGVKAVFDKRRYVFTLMYKVL